MSISIAQVARMTGQNRVKVGRWKRERPQLYTIIEFGCEKLLAAVPKRWTYSYEPECYPDGPHFFVNEVDGRKLQFVHAETFIEGLNEIKERTK